MARSGALDALADFAGAMLPLRARNLQTVIDEHLSEIPNKLNEYGYDAYGMSPLWMRRVLMPFALLYRYYFRVEVSGIEHLPTGCDRLPQISDHALRQAVRGGDGLPATVRAQRDPAERTELSDGAFRCT